MDDRIKEMADLCISHKLPLTILRTEGHEAQLISFIALKLSLSKTAGMIIECKIFDRSTFKLTEEIIYLTKEEFINSSLGFELAEI
jgi:hypothetical protein